MSATDGPPPRDLEDRLRRLNEIGIALSRERNLTVLLERILLEGRRFTRADAGTLYLRKDNCLTFEIAQNDTLGVASGGSRGRMNVPPVPINRDSLSGYVALTGEPLAIDDVYADATFGFTGPREYDRLTGYRTRSVLGVPLTDHEGAVIGVMQLINAADPDAGEVVPFSAEDQALTRSLASQAAVAVTNVRLIHDMENLFESFLQVLAAAIDERSPYTGGHIRRVAEMTMVLAEAVHACRDGPLAAVTFTPDEMNELRIASWMHDVGKITTPEWIVDKPTKLTTVFDRIELLRTRFALIAQTVRAEMLERRAAFAAAGKSVPAGFAEEYDRRLAQINDDRTFLEKVNAPGEFLDDAALVRLREIAGRTYAVEGEEKPYLTADELENLSIRKGSLTAAERQKINDHAAMSIRMLEQIPFPRKLARVPAIAGAHHEKLDGSGYPRGLKADAISVQGRILALIDIFESLSADDRPYRSRPMTRETVLRILREEVEANHLDRDLFDLFVSQELYRKLDEIKARATNAARG